MRRSLRGRIAALRFVFVAMNVGINKRNDTDGWRLFRRAGPGNDTANRHNGRTTSSIRVGYLIGLPMFDLSSHESAHEGEDHAPH
jgi:hypothetical protein